MFWTALRRIGPFAGALVAALALTHCSSSKPSTADAGVVIGRDSGPILGGSDGGTQGVLCQPCQTDPQCNPGSTTGNFCVADPGGAAVCGTACLVSSDCPLGYDCYVITGTTANAPASGHNCLPANNASCTATSTGTSELCKPCTMDTQCNPAGGSANFCLQDPQGASACGIACGAGGNCPAGSLCYDIGGGDAGVVGSNCYPQAGTSCFAGTGTSTSVLCRPCTSTMECNPDGGTANRCSSNGASAQGACGTACASNSDCFSGYTCYQIVGANNQVVAHNCLPANNGTCP